MVLRTSATLAFILGAIVLIPACDGGFSNSEASERCEEIRAEQLNNMPADAVEACVSCHEECGDACAVLDTAVPTRFECID